MLQKAEDCISGTNDVMISLGGFGGYVTFCFDHTVINRPGEKDFRIWGNCFYELTDPGRKGGSAEPGIVMVSYDANCNGLPDDPWYELAGSDYRNPATRHNYSITYRRPDPSQTPVEDETGFLSDIRYIPWTDSEGAGGYMPKNIFHSQDYYPKWVGEDEITLRARACRRTESTPAASVRISSSIALTGDMPTTIPTIIPTSTASTFRGRWTPRATQWSCPAPTSSAFTPESTNIAAGWGRLPPKSAAPRTSI